MSGTVVAGYRPTPEGEAALRAGGEEARLRGARLLVVSTTRGESNVAADLPQTSQLAMETAKIRASGVDVEVRRLGGMREAAEELLRIADEVSAVLVVIGLKRRSAVGKLLLGSTAQRVLLDARCSVLAVRSGG